MSANVRNALPGFLRGQQPGASGVSDAVYLPERRELRVTFKSGRTFAYSDVPQAIYDAYLASPSKGAFFNIAIRGRFQFHELTPFEPATRH
ncbi:KTSC domain-containing protein [Pseudorhodoplanes sp.]|uniref:KTSC domain-containing protein n=1 Tax=Pseudorhodoplanes sp. TaxID=1934341 RepID=UPI002B620E36|nr:KTSC domain-containing protein [Pseudorhodoplanes sp.]HWV53204.1 KTSC domain-containing protein [Pseudorhodoplanes sp.]